MKRWLVERTPDHFETVTADTFHVHESGAAMFRPSIWEHVTLVLAPGQWISVVPEED